MFTPQIEQHKNGDAKQGADDRTPGCAGNAQCRQAPGTKHQSIGQGQIDQDAEGIGYHDHPCLTDAGEIGSQTGLD